MATHVPLQRPGYAGSRSAYSGFSWTTFFFGFFPALFRGDGMGLLFGIGVWIASAITWTFFLGWIPWLIWAAVYNRNHFERLLSEGWYPIHHGSLYSLTTPAAPAIAAPAGWYVDPLDPNRLRWWNGAAWGDTSP